MSSEHLKDLKAIRRFPPADTPTAKKVQEQQHQCIFKTPSERRESSISVYFSNSDSEQVAPIV